MSIEERAHDFAIEIMKMYFAENKAAMTDDADNTHSDVVINNDDLFSVYNTAFQRAIELYNGKTH